MHNMYELQWMAHERQQEISSTMAQIRQRKPARRTPTPQERTEAAQRELLRLRYAR